MVIQIVVHVPGEGSATSTSIYVYITVLRPGKGECADPVNEDAILEKEGGESPGRNKERQLASDTGGGET